MNRILNTMLMICLVISSFGQGPEITSWLQNTTETGTYYVTGNSNAIDNNILVNCQLVEYSEDWVYIHTKGIPSYPTGPFQDGNPSQASDQDAIYQISLNPMENEGTHTATTGGNIGVFVNGVSLFDFRDGVGWDSDAGALCGGPGYPMCPGPPMSLMDWNRDAIPAEMPGFDCSKAHPAMGNYHHHQNPSAFKLDLEVVSDVCNLYDAEGLYAINDEAHSPLIGFAYDGFPIYGAYGFKNADGTGGIVRIRSGYQLRDITQRTTWADGTDVDDGPDVSATYELGYFREDYEFIEHPGEEEYLDEHNGRICITPEYPDGTYAYFATVDENWNSAYPYAVGPTYYGVVNGGSVDSVNESTTVYTGSTGLEAAAFNTLEFTIFPNPSSDLIAIQVNGLLKDKLVIDLINSEGKVVKSTSINKGSTISYFDVQTVYSGDYILKISNQENFYTEKISILR